MNSGIDAVIFDVDGTLYDYRTHTVPPSAQEALRCLREGGIRIIIASGRSYALLGESLVQTQMQIPPDIQTMTMTTGIIMDIQTEVRQGNGCMMF